jgi:RNA polymerase sigma-70 factor (ECF subfamily)
VPQFEQPVPWGELEDRYRAEVGAGLTPEQNYHRSYALELLGTALARLQREAEQAGRRDMFEALREWLSRDPPAGVFDDVARRLRIRPLAAVVALKRLRQRFRELAEAELCETVASADDLAAERDALALALARTPP